MEGERRPTPVAHAPHYVLGIDLGTTSVKVCLVDEATAQVVAEISQTTKAGLNPAGRYKTSWSTRRAGDTQYSRMELQLQSTSNTTTAATSARNAAVGANVCSHPGNGSDHSANSSGSNEKQPARLNTHGGRTSVVVDEQSPVKIVVALQYCLSAIDRGQLNHVTKISICGQMHGVVLWTRDAWTYDLAGERFTLRPDRVSPLVTWQDARCTPAFLDSLPAPSSCEFRAPRAGYGCATMFWMLRHTSRIGADDGDAGVVYNIVPIQKLNLHRQINEFATPSASTDTYRIQTKTVDSDFYENEQGDGVDSDVGSGEEVYERGAQNNEWSTGSRSLNDFDCAGTIQDLVVAMLADRQRPLMTVQNADSFGYFDARSGRWDVEALAAADFPCYLLPDVVPPTLSTAAVATSTTVATATSTNAPARPATIAATAETASAAVAAQVVSVASGGSKTTEVIKGVRSSSDPDENRHCLTADGLVGDTLSTHGRTHERFQTAAAGGCAAGIASAQDAACAGRLRYFWLGVPARTEVYAAFGDTQCAALSCLHRRALGCRRQPSSSGAIHVSTGHGDDGAVDSSQDAQAVECSGGGDHDGDGASCAILNIGTSAQLMFEVAANESGDRWGGRRGVSTDGLSAEEKPPDDEARYTWFPYFNGNYLCLAASLNGGNVLTHFVSLVESWMAALGRTVPTSFIWERLLLPPVDGSREVDADLSTKMCVHPVIFGERFDPALTGLVAGLTPQVPTLDETFRAICRGIVENLLELLPLKILKKHNVQTIICTGKVINCNNPLRDEIIRIFKGFKIEFENQCDSAYGAAVAVLNKA